MISKNVKYQNGGSLHNNMWNKFSYIVMKTDTILVLNKLMIIQLIIEKIPGQKIK